MNRHMIFSVIYIKIFGIISTVFGTYLKSHIHYKKRRTSYHELQP